MLADRKRDRPTSSNSSIRIDRAVRRAVKAKGRIRFAFESKVGSWSALVGYARARLNSSTCLQ
jgi:hypothetical protein